MTRRGDEGLTTLGWLLMVAAVAGLAALGLVVVQQVVGGTAEDVASQRARQQAAFLAATELEQRWRAQAPSTREDADRINGVHAARCRRLAVIYGDIDLEFVVFAGTFKSGGGWDTAPACNLV